MNSASRGLWPVVGLRRPGKAPFASAEADAWRASALRGRFQSASKAFTPNEFGLQGPLAGGRPTPTWESVLLRRRRPTPGAQRLRRPISIGTKAFGRWSACADLEKHLLRRRRPTPGAERLERPISIGAKAFGRRSACTPNEFGLQGPLAGGRPAPTWKSTFCVGGGRRLARQRLERPISIGVKGLRPVVGLRRPGEDPFASAEADAWRGAPEEADFNRRQGLRPVVGLRRPGKRSFASAEADAWRAAP
jgi:hypothetical protein